MTHSFPSTISLVLWALNLKKCSLSKYTQKKLSTIMIPTTILSMILKVKKFPFWAFELRKWIRCKRIYFASFSLIFKCVINEGSTNILIHKNINILILIHKTTIAKEYQLGLIYWYVIKLSVTYNFLHECSLLVLAFTINFSVITLKFPFRLISQTLEIVSCLECSFQNLVNSEIKQKQPLEVFYEKRCS